MLRRFIRDATRRCLAAAAFATPLPERLGVYVEARAGPDDDGGVGAAVQSDNRGTSVTSTRALESATDSWTSYARCMKACDFWIDFQGRRRRAWLPESHFRSRRDAVPREPDGNASVHAARRALRGLDQGVDFVVDAELDSLLHP